MQYMLLIDDDPSAWAGMSEEQVNAVMGEYFAYSAAIREEGIFVDGNALKGPEEARTVRVRDGKQVVADGPFAETKELVGGYYVVDRDTIDQAHRRRRTHPERALRCGRGAPRRTDVSKPPPLQREAISWLYREWFGRAVGVLARSVGDLDLAEEVVQDAFATALERWPRDGIPDEPGAWIIRTARNRAIDVLRRRRMAARARAPGGRAGGAAPRDRARARLDHPGRAARADVRVLQSAADHGREHRAHAAPRRGPDARPGRPRAADDAPGDLTAPRALEAHAARRARDRWTSPPITSCPSVSAPCSP